MARFVGKSCAAAGAGAIMLMFGAARAAAATLVVALGASNTAGMGVAPSQAYPSILEQMLKAQGYDVHVINAGINGDTTAGMLARLPGAVPDGTRVVILQPGGNDGRKGVQSEHAGNIASIQSALAARHIKVVMLPNALLKGIPAKMYQPDGIHLTPEGYALLARQMLPQVTRALGGH